VDSFVVVAAIGVGAALVALYTAARRAVTIAELEIEAGVLRVVRGGIAPPVLADLRDVARRPPIADLRVRITRSSGRAAVELVGDVTAEQAQRIRNVIGSVPLARLVNAPRRR
jgi:Protein of unknown function (DUF3634)